MIQDDPPTLRSSRTARLNKGAVCIRSAISASYRRLVSRLVWLLTRSSFRPRTSDFLQVLFSILLRPLSRATRDSYAATDIHICFVFLCDPIADLRRT